MRCAGLIGFSTVVDQVSYMNTGNMFATLMSLGSQASRKATFNRQILTSLGCAVVQGVVTESMLLI
eukprot:SAG11_NODE_13921_length_633_cov_0.936330_1_plen_65_part_10